MIKYLTHKEIDKVKWDKCISMSHNTSVYGYSWYLDALNVNWDAIILNDYEAVFPLPIKSKFGIQIIFQPFFNRYLAIFSKYQLSQELVSMMFDAIPKKNSFIEFSIHETTIFDRHDFSSRERTFQKLAMNLSYEDLYKNYKGDAKRNIKKAEKEKLESSVNTTPEVIVNLFKKNKGNELNYLKDTDYQNLKNLMDTSIKRGVGISLSTINKAGEAIAAGFFIKTDDTIYFIKGSANEEGKSISAMYIIVDTIIKKYANQVKYLDFGGSSIPGVASFNRNFGAKDYVYLQVKRNRLPFLIKLMSGKK